MATTTRTWLLAATALLAAAAHAAPVAYTDRAAFQAALAGYAVDNLNDVTDGYYGSGMSRSDYAFTMQSYGCHNGASTCGDNTDDGFTYPAYVWTYGSGSFDFNSTIYGFGLDFGFFDGGTTSASVTLNGLTHTVQRGGFLGFIDTDGFSSVTYAAQGSGSLFDNVTYSAQATGGTLPEPATLALVGTGLLGCLLRRRAR